MKVELTATEFETALQRRYKGKNCSLSIPRYDTVHGLVDEITLDVKNPPEVIIQMNERRYTVSPECITECLKKLKNGNT